MQEPCVFSFYGVDALGDKARIHKTQKMNLIGQRSTPWLPLGRACSIANDEASGCPTSPARICFFLLCFGFFCTIRIGTAIFPKD